MKEIIKFTSINDSYPEDNKLLLDNSIEDLEQTLDVLVKTDNGSIFNTRRVKMQIGNNLWEWVMSMQDERIMEWTPLKTN